MIRFFIFCSFLLLLSCTKKPDVLSPGAYSSWLKAADNPMLKIKQVDNITVSVQYRSPEAMALQKSGEQSTPEQYQKALEEAGNLQYYFIRMKLNGSTEDIIKYGTSDGDEFMERKYYYNFHFQNDVKLVIGNDSLPCRLYHHPETYGVSPNADFIIAFDDAPDKKNIDRTLVINDQIYGMGTLKFLYTATEIQTLPQIKF